MRWRLWELQFPLLPFAGSPQLESTLKDTNPEFFSRVQAMMASAEGPSSPSAAPSLPETVISPEPSPLAAETPVALAAASTQLALPYSHEAMIELMIEHPNWTHKQFAAYWGKGAGWFASILASDNFQLALDGRRGEIANPEITATLDERYRAVVLRGLDVLQDRLGGKEVSDNLILRAVEIGGKALGMGQDKAPPVAPTGSVDALAERLMSAFAKQKGNVRAPVLVEGGVVVGEVANHED